jgi:tRNA(fMet)-specific endonuclease VapC
MYLLDTNHCSRIIDGDENVIKAINDLGDTIIATCAIVRGELIYMAHKSERYAENLSLVEDFLKDIDVYPIDENTATIYGELKIAVINHFGPHEKAKRRKIEIDKLGFKENDLWIAAVAKQYEFVIVSADSDFQRMKEAYDLEVTTWYQNIFDEK